MATNDHSTPSAHNDDQRHLSVITTTTTTHAFLQSEDPTLISASTPVPSTLVATTPEKQPQSSDIKIDLRDHLKPHNDPSNPFAFVPEQLSALMDPKNLPLLYSYGGLNGIAKGLHVDLQTGLVPNVKIQTPVTLNDVMQHDHHQPEQPQRSPRARSMTILSNATGVTKSDAAAAFPQRVSVFGRNVLPEVKAKSIFQLMWMAFQDKTLVR